MSINLLDDSLELINEYVAESLEHASLLDDLLLELEKNKLDKIDCITKMFRIFHSIKGASGFFNFHNLEKVSHQVENLLVQLREGERKLDPILIEILFFSTDIIKNILNYINLYKKEEPKDYSKIIEMLGKVLVKNEISMSDVRFFKNDFLNQEDSKESNDESLKIKIDTVERLLNLSSEIVLLKNSLVDMFNNSEKPQVIALLQQFKIISADLQDTIMQVRMQPIRSLWSKFPRIVRDTAILCGKEAKLVLKGEETEVEKNILTALKDPFTHIIRNALDHGIETGEIRTVRKKNLIGIIEFNAFQKEDHIFIEIKDDGAGIDPERVKRKAIEKKLISTQNAAQISDQDAIELIFNPGFSTNEEVSNLSGRGVGMDVVKSSVMQMGGMVSIESKIGIGTKLTIKIPLSLSIVPCLIIQNNGINYGVPQNYIRQVLSYHSAKIEKDLIHYRGKLLPFLEMNKIFNVANENSMNYSNVLILESSQGIMALSVGKVFNVQELVIKPMPLKMKEIHELSGNALLSNGDIGLVINIDFLMQKYKIKEQTQNVQDQIFDHYNDSENSSLKTFFLSFNYGGKQTFAIESQYVERIIKVNNSFYVQDNVGRINYHEKSVSVICPYKILNIEYKEDILNNGHILILNHKFGYLGILVHSVHDMLAIESKIFDCLNRRYVSGTFLLQDKSIDILHIENLVKDLNPPSFIIKEAS